MTDTNDVFHFGGKNFKPTNLKNDTRFKKFFGQTDDIIHVDTFGSFGLIILRSGKALVFHFSDKSQFHILEKKFKRFVHGALNHFHCYLITDSRQSYEFEFKSKILRQSELIDVRSKCYFFPLFLE